MIVARFVHMQKSFKPITQKFYGGLFVIGAV
jgi:hypothetical protein